jgi:hypothetical protein
MRRCGRRYFTEEEVTRSRGFDPAEHEARKCGGCGAWHRRAKSAEVAESLRGKEAPSHMGTELVDSAHITVAGICSNIRLTGSPGDHEWYDTTSWLRSNGGAVRNAETEREQDGQEHLPMSLLESAERIAQLQRIGDEIGKGPA